MNSKLDTSEAQEFLSGKLAHVNVAKIEKELSGLWKQAAHGDPDSPDAMLVRACAFNLIMFTDAENAESTCSDLLDEIEQHLPCRSILAIFRPKKPHQLNAWVSARCHTMGSSKQICSEQITVCCDGGNPDELASVVLPLVLPDLPVFIWWRKSALDLGQLNALRPCASRLIVDSALAQFEPQMFKDASKLIKQRDCGLHVSDVNWRGLQGWCHAIADAFDGFPVNLAMLKQISRITIEQAGDAGISNRALLLVGWLASRLGWTPKGLNQSKKTASFTDAGRTIDIAFTPRAGTEQHGRLRQVTIEFAPEGKAPPQKLIIVPQATDGARFIIASLEGTHQQEATRIASRLSETILVGQELSMLGADPIFEQSVHMIANLLAVRN